MGLTKLDIGVGIYLGIGILVTLLIPPQAQSALLTGWQEAEVAAVQGATIEDVTATSAGFLAVGHRAEDEDTIAAWESTDGKTWTSVDLSDIPADARRGRLVSVTSRAEQIVAAGELDVDGRTDVGYWLSQDAGTSWERIPHDDELFADAHVEDVASFAEGFFAAGWQATQTQDAAVAWRSPDGILWERIKLSIDPDSNDRAYAAVEAAGGPLIAGMSQGPGDALPVWTSTDAHSWGQLAGDESPLAAAGLALRGLTSAKVGVVAVGADEAGPVALHRSQGGPWEEASALPGIGADEANVVSVTSNSEDFLLAVGSLPKDGEPTLGVWMSEDARTWEQLEDPVLDAARGVEAVAVVASGRTTVVATRTSDGQPRVFVHRPGQTS